MTNNWKEYLLKSGLPFEYEVKECFAKNRCTVWDEYTYLKEDENRIEKEFSYDLDANLWNGGYSIDFLIECKYKTKPTKWFFTPNPYAYQNDLSKNSFFHPIDYFTNNKFIFAGQPFDNVIKKALGPFCLKGIEVYNGQSQEINISKAINQLAYAFVDKLISAMDSQLNVKMFYDSIFLHIPIIITNADLFLFNQDLTTNDIQKADSIEEISTQHNFLIFQNKIGENLRGYNYKKLAYYFTEIGKENFNNRNKSFSNDLEHFISVISQNYCPQVILIMHHDTKHDNFNKLFDYINFITIKSDEREKRIVEVQDEMKKEFENIDNMIKKIKKPK